MATGGNFTACNCGPDTPDCQSPTEPLATVGLCLADGTPIAVVVVRDCAANVTSQGWINLATGQYWAGAVPAGAVACGDARSIQVSGTFCDIDPATGEVLALVLIEYSYAADGSIAGVRLVDATTGATYTPAGEITTCPAGVEQPERDLIWLCDTAPDGTVTAFIRDYTRDGNGAVIGYADYALGGGPYTPAGTVSACDLPEEESPAEPCQDCQSHLLCDRIGAADIPTGATSGTLPGGTAWEVSCSTAGPDGWAWAAFPCPLDGAQVWTFDRPVTAVWSTALGSFPPALAGSVVMPEGSVAVSVHQSHAWDPDTRTLTALPGAALADGASTFRIDRPVTELAFTPVESGGGSTQRHATTAMTVAPAEPVTFLRTWCRDCAGEVIATVDTTLDGDPYSPAGTVAPCAPAAQAAPDQCVASVQVLRLCDLDPDAEPDAEGRRCAVPFLRTLVFGCDGELTATRDTTPDDQPYSPVQVVDCGTGGAPAMVEVPWEIIGIEPDPASEPGRGLIFRLSPPDDPATVGTITVTTTSSYNPASCPTEPPEYSYRNPTVYTFTPDQVLRDAATYVRVDLRDFDTFEPVTALTPPPDRLGGTAYWDGTTIRPTESNGTGQMFYDGPPEQWSYRVGNTGGGNSCSQLAFAAVSLRPQGCCGCDTEPVAEPCRDSSSVLLCDIPTEGQTGAPVTATDTPSQDTSQSTVQLPGGAPAFWAGQTFEVPADPDGSAGNGSQVYRAIAAVLTADRPACDDGTATVTASMRVRLNGPSPGVGTTGRVTLLNAGAVLATRAVPMSAPVGWEETFTFTGQVSAADLAAGTVTIEMFLETFHGGPKSWTLSEFSATADFGTEGCETQILRTLVTDCETGQVISVTDTTVDGTPYEVTGQVGQCRTAGGQCCPPPPPETRLDVETALLCVRDQASGDITGQVIAERVYDDQTGQLTETRFTDPATGEPVEPPAGAVLGPCADPCPHAFSTECVGVAERSEASYDNTSLIAGEPGQCGSVQGPSDSSAGYVGAQFACGGGPYTITSWVVDGVEVISEGSGGRTFLGGPCGTGTDANPGMHRNWAEALTNLDPTGATWVVDSKPGCAWYIRSEGGSGNVYGPMTITGDGLNITDGTWVLGPAQSCQETQYTRVYQQDCDGQISVVWLDQAGNPVQAPAGEYVRCGTGCSPAGGDGLDVEVLALCDVQGDGSSVPFLRHILYDTGGAVALVTDTGLDGFSPYAPSGTVGACAPDPEPAPHVTQVCRCDDTDGDGIADTDYTEVLEVAPDGALTSIGTYTADMSGPYAPVSPVPCPAAGSPGPELDAEAVVLCDLTDGGPVPFLRHLRYNDAGEVIASADTALDGTTAYTPAGEVTACPAGEAGPVEGREVELTPMCVIDNATGKVLQPILAEVVYDTATGQRVGVDYVDPVTWGPVAVPGGARLGVCPDPETPECPAQVIEACRCDDTDGDGTGDTDYTELLAVSCTGEVTSIGTYTADMSGPYAPVAPVPCPADQGPEPQLDAEAVVLCDLTPEGATPFLRHLRYNAAGEVITTSDTALDGTTPYSPAGAVTVCPHEPLPVVVATGAARLTGGASADYGTTYPGLQSLTVTVVAGEAQVTLNSGQDVAVPAGASLTWSVTGDGQVLDVASVAASASGDVLVNFTYAEQG